VVSYVLKAGLSYLLADIFHIKYFYSYLITLVAVIAFNFVSSSLFIFRVSDQKFSLLVKYLSSLLIFYFADAGLFMLFTDWLGFYYQCSIFASTFSIFLVKFFIYKFLVFKKREIPV